MLRKASYHFTGVNLSQIVDTLCSMSYKTSQPIKNHNNILIALVLVEGVPLAQGPVSRTHEFANLSCFGVLAYSLS